VDACPVDCIHPGKTEAELMAADQLYINADECICCGCCVPACPVSAIYAEEDLPQRWKHFTQLNAGWFRPKP
jgi:ferredoxin